MNRTLSLLAVAVVMLLIGCPKDKSADGADVASALDSQTLSDTATTDVTAVADDTDTAVFPDIAPDLPPADTAEVGDMEEDAKVYTYVPTDPCAEEPVAPAEGSTCTTIDELRCSDFEQKADKSFTFQTSAGLYVAQVCKRLHVLRCESTDLGFHWVRHFAADLVDAETVSASVKSEGIWCMNTKAGVALEPGLCDNPDENGKTFKACAPSLAGMVACSGTGLGTCGTPDVVDTLVAKVPGTFVPPNQSATLRLGKHYGYCSQFSRRYVVASCTQKDIACKYTKPNGEYYFQGFPSKCVIDDIGGAHCATTCEEIGMEGPPKW